MTSTRLSDPRRFDDGRQSPFGEAAYDIAAAPADERKRLLSQLAKRMSTMLEQGEGQKIREALSKPRSSSACRILLQALERALSTNEFDGGVSVRIFAIPVLFVVGGGSASRVDAAVQNAGEIRSLFETAGTLGHCRNFGLSNALTDLGCLENISW